MGMKKLIMTMAVCVGLGGTVLAQKTANDYDTLLGNYYPYYYYNYRCDNYNVLSHPLCFYTGTFVGGYRFISRVVSSQHEEMQQEDYWCEVGYPDLELHEEIALYIHPDTAIRVVGIAFGDMCQHSIRLFHLLGLDSVHYLYSDSGVFKITVYDTNMNVIRSKYVNHDTLPAVRQLYLKHCTPEWPQDREEDQYVSIHECYFDIGIDITEDFYIGVSKQDTTYAILTALYEYHCWKESDIPMVPLERCRYRLSSQQEGGWLDEVCGLGMSTLLWPILEFEEDTCPEVRGLRWSRLGSGTTAFVQWDAGVNHRDWQLSYGPSGTPAGEGTVVDCPPAQCVLPGLAAGVTYDIYVRARCRFARDEWTGWSGPLEVGFGSPGEGIEGVEGVHAELTPNPATGRVRVSCGEALRMVEVYDLQGRRCLAQEVQGSETVLDISALAAGRYTVLLHTATTTAARPLIVQ